MDRWRCDARGRWLALILFKLRLRRALVGFWRTVDASGNGRTAVPMRHLRRLGAAATSKRGDREPDCEGHGDELAHRSSLARNCKPDGCARASPITTI